MQALTALWCVLGVLLGIWTVVYRRRRSRFVSLVNKLPGPPYKPIVGNLPDLLVPRSEIMAVRQAWASKFGPLFRTWMGSTPVVYITRPELAEVILGSMKHLEKSHIYKLMTPWLGEGLLTSKGGSKWRLHRKLITPTFHFKVLDSFVEVFLEKGQRLLQHLEKHSGGGAFDICPYISSCALDIICETAMGTQMDVQMDTVNPYVAAVYEMSQLISERSLRPWLFFTPVFKCTSIGKQTAKCIAELHGFTNKVIRGRKALRASEMDKRRSSEQTEKNTVGEKKRQAFLDLLLDSCDNEKLLTDTEIREEVDTFMFEERVHRELDEVFGDSERPATTKDLQRLKYLEQVVKETLRLYPSVGYIGRKLAEDTHIGEYLLPAGCLIAINIYQIHRSADQFPDPEAFDPDNFLPDRAKGRHPYAYIPFSAGPRNCIGQKFALLEEKVLLAAILRRYQVRTLQRLEDITLLCELILRSEDGIKLQIVPRPRFA